MTPQHEIWKPIPLFESFYQVSNFGRIKRIAKGGPAKIGHILSPSKDACGYLRVRLCKSAQDQKVFRVHRLVLSAFVGQLWHECETNHKNRIRDDNRLENLEYISHADNVRYSALAYSKKGSANANAKLSESEVLLIRKLHAKGKRQKELAVAFKTNKYAIYDIVHRRSWTHI